MLEKVKLIGFQKHKKKVLRFDPRVTTIVGDTNAGKSCFLRSLAFVGLNLTPKGRFIHFDKDVTSVILYVDGHTILRKKGKATNVYIVDGSESHRAVGSDVPPAVEKILNLSGLNFQWQRDQPFWFAETSGQVSKNLNEIINLGSIDRTLANVGQEIRKLKSSETESLERLETAMKKRKEMSWVPTVLERFARVSSAFDSWRSAGSQRLAVAFLVRPGTSQRASIERALDAGRTGSKLIEDGSKIIRMTQARQDLENLLQNVRRLKRCVSIEYPDIDELSAFRNEADQVAEDRRELEFLVTEAQQAKERLCQSERSLSKAVKRLRKRVKGKCPLCGTKLKSSASVVPTFTCEKKHLSPVERRIGTR